MIRLFAISILVLFLFGNCHKEENEMKVYFNVHETSASVPQFNVTYTEDKSGSSASVSSSSDNWNSPTLIFKKGQFVSMTLDCTSPQYDFSLDIIVDGAIFREAELHNPNSTITISGNIGN